MNPPRTPIKIRLTPPPPSKEEAPDIPPATTPAAGSSEEYESFTTITQKPVVSEPSPEGKTPVFKSRRGRLRHWATHPTVILSMGLSGLILLIWNLGVRLPGKKDLLTVQARSLANMPDPTQIRTPLNPEAIAALRREVDQARSYLVQDTSEMVKLASKIEQLALEQGWRAEVFLKPSVPAPADLPDTKLIPAEIILTDQPQLGQEPTATGYFRLLTFLRQLKDLNKKIEISDLNLKAGSTGLQSAETKLHIWIEQNDAKSPAK